MLFDYRITENVSRVNNFIDGGTRLLYNRNTNQNVTQINININSVSSTNIDLNLTLIRANDDVLIKGEVLK